MTSPFGVNTNDGVGEQVDLHHVEELVGVVELLLALHQLAQPVELRLVARAAPALVLVLPVGGDAELGVPVHLLGADLHLHALAVGADHRRVERLVAVGLRQRDVVLEAARHRRPGRVHDAERRVAGLAAALEHDAERDHVVDVVEGDALGLHLVVDRGQLLRAAASARPTMPAAASLRREDRRSPPRRTSRAACGCPCSLRSSSAAASGFSARKARSASSRRTQSMPRRCASGHVDVLRSPRRCGGASPRP